MVEEPMTVATYTNLMEAHLAVLFLEERGIRAHLEDENLSQWVWYLTRAVGGIKLCVPRDDFEEAARLLSQQAQKLASQRESESLAEKRHRIHLENPRRALCAAYLSLLCPPLAFWSLWIVAKEANPGNGEEWSAGDRSALNFAALWSIGIVVAFTLILLPDLS